MPFVFQQVPLRSDGTPNEGYPGTDYATFNPYALSPTPNRPQWLFVWANHCRPEAAAKPNPPIVNDRGFVFSTIAKANAATIGKLLAAFKGPDAARTFCAAQGLRYVAWDNLSALAKAPRVRGQYSNVVYGPPLVRDYVEGFVLDYEVGDERTRSISLSFLRNVSDRFADVRRQFYANEVGSPNYLASGLAGAETMIARRFQAVSVLQQKNERNLVRQAGVYENPSRVYVTLDLATNTLASCQWVKSLVQNRNWAGVNFWRNGADVDAPATKAKMALFSDWIEGQ